MTIKQELEFLNNPRILCPRMYSFDETRNLLNEQKKKIVKIVNKKSDIRKAKPADKLEKGYDIGYDDKTDEIIKKLK